MVTTLEPMRQHAAGLPARTDPRPPQRPTPRAERGDGPGAAHRPRHQAVRGRPQEEARHWPWTTSRIRIERGETYGILGANGGGKSTLIRLVSTLLTLDTGRVEVFGHDIERDEMAVKRLINRVSVDAAFFKKLSPYENLIYAARLYGLDAGQAKRDAVAILARLGISEKRLGRPLEQMSRGMQQKVAIARALLTSPTLLLLDEPTTGLDPRSKLEVQTFIEEIRDGPRRDDRAHHARPRGGRAPVRPASGSSTTAAWSPRARPRSWSSGSPASTASHPRSRACS